MTVSRRKRQQLAMLTLTPDKLVRLSPDLKIGDFDCGDADLNEFLRDDATTYLTELLSVTDYIQACS